MPRRADKRWTPEVIARLGRVSDRSIARDLGISATAVHKKRAGLGISPFNWRRQGKPQELERLGTAPGGNSK